MAVATHGGRVFALARQLGCSPGEILDFSASINPLGPPSAVLAAARRALSESHHYPDIAAEPLVEDLAAFHGMSQANLLAGAGATEFIYGIPRALGYHRALIISPAFSEYAAALQTVCPRIDHYVLERKQGFALNLETLYGRLTPETDLVILANPLNPVGSAFSRNTMLALLKILPPTITLLLDEAFIDFCPERSILDRVTVTPNLLVLRSMTKFYAIPGLRVGYLAGPIPLLEEFAQYREPWRLSVPAIAAARACLLEEDFRRRTLDAIPAWRAALAEQLVALGCRTFPSNANYLLCDLPQSAPSAATVVERLAKVRLLVRDCRDFAGLGERTLRIAVRPPEECRILLAALQGCLHHEEIDG